MRNRFIPGLIAFCLTAAVDAQSLFDKITEGAGKAAETVGDATQSAVDTTSGLVKKGADKVDETIESTKESLSDEATPEATRAKLDAMGSELRKVQAHTS